MRNSFTIPLRDGGKVELGKRTVIVGVLNVTPDSFSDGGRFFEASLAVEQAIQIESEGADILEVGGESTRPGASLISAEEEAGRVIPVLRAISGRVRIPTAIDTTKSGVEEQDSIPMFKPSYSRVGKCGLPRLPPLPGQFE